MTQGLPEERPCLRTIYIENLTGEIFKELIGIIYPKTKDKIFLDCQERVRKIIAREYVEIEEQKK